MDIAVYLIAGLIALVAGAELLVQGASQLALRFRISPLIIGLTVVAFGTSAPEMAVSVASSLNGEADIAVGNVVGSNIFNVLFILGVSALIIPLVVDQKLVRFDVPLMIAASGLVWFFGHDGNISQIEGSLLFAGLITYTACCIVVARKESAKVQNEYAQEFQTVSEAVTLESTVKSRSLLWQLGLIVFGLVLLVLGATWLVEGATTLARRLGVSELIIGLTIVACGTSLPEVATSIVAAMKGERDIAVGNVVGSNLFNLFGVLGLAAISSPTGIVVADQALYFDLPVMVAVAFACLPVFFTGHFIARWEGGLFFTYYIAYTVTLIMLSTDSVLLPRFKLLIFGFVLPLTIVTLFVGTARAISNRRAIKSFDT